jgi:hypothetical protein
MSEFSSNFKDKNIKYSSFCNNILNKSLLIHGTLDSKHQDKMKEFDKRDKVLLKLQNKLYQLNEEYNIINQKNPIDYIEEDIIKKAKIKDDITEIQNEIDNLNNMSDTLDYFNNTIDLLSKYYDNENENENDNNIIDIFNIKKNDDKAQIFYKYLKRTNQIDLNYKQKKNKIKICSQCNIDKVLHLQDGLISCVQCGNCDFILVDSDIPCYKNQIVDNKPNGYKRMNHFSELLNQFQGKESTEIPNEVFEKIIDEINKLRIEDLSTLNNYTIRAILKKLNLNFYYEHIPFIINKLNGIPPPSINRELEDKLRQMFKEVQEPFILYKPKNRKNFLNNNYVFRKLFELLEADHLLSSFPFLKSKEKLYEHDQIWKKICEYNNWQFIESI